MSCTSSARRRLVPLLGQENWNAHLDVPRWVYQGYWHNEWVSIQWIVPLWHDTAESDTIVWDHSLLRVTPNWKEQFCELMRTKPSIRRMRRKGPKQRQLGRMASSDRDDDSGVSYADRQDSERDLEPPPLMLFPSPLNVPIFCHLNATFPRQEPSGINEFLAFSYIWVLDHN